MNWLMYPAAIVAAAALTAVTHVPLPEYEETWSSIHVRQAIAHERETHALNLPYNCQ